MKFIFCYVRFSNFRTSNHFWRQRLWRGYYLQCYSPGSKTVWQVQHGFHEMIWQRFPAKMMELILELLHVERVRQLTGAGE